MLRYLYPLIMSVLILLFFRCTSQPFLADSALGPLFIFFIAMGATIMWPFFIGNRLHEPSWRKLAQQLHLAYQPYRTGEGKYKPAQIEGVYRGRVVRLTTLRTIKRWKSWSRGPLIRCHMSLKLRVNAPAHFKMEVGEFGADLRLKEIPKTGDAQFDQRLFLYARPDFIVKHLTETKLTAQLWQIVHTGRPIRLNKGELLFEEQANLFMGAESNIKRLMQIIDVMCNLADTVEQHKRPEIPRPDFPAGKNIITDGDIRSVADLEHYYQLPTGFEYQQEEGASVIIRVADGTKFSFLIEAEMLTFDEPYIREDGRTGYKTTEIIKQRER